MSNDSFLNAIEKLKQRNMDIDAEAQYMSDINHYLIVHATKYLPKTNGQGIQYIPSTAMATNYSHPRSTIHVALNHVVFGHMGGDWSEVPYIILAPLTDVIELNGNPADMSVPDTYFSVHPDKGLQLPTGTRIVMPANDIPDGQLFQIRGNTTVYKSQDFTSAETKIILNNMHFTDKAVYDKYKSADINDLAVKVEISKLGNTGQKLYETARDKKAFLRGLFADKCEAILAQYVRNMAMQETASEMGFRTIQNVTDGSKTLFAVADVAESKNIFATAANKGHSNSIYGLMDQTTTIIKLLQENLLENSNNLDQLATYLTTSEYVPFRQIVLQALLPDKTLNVYDIFRSQFEYEKNQWYNTRFHDCKTIADWDPNTDETIRRYSKTKSKEFEVWLNKIKAMPDYTQFVNKIQVSTLMRPTNKYEH